VLGRRLRRGRKKGHTAPVSRASWRQARAVETCQARRGTRPRHGPPPGRSEAPLQGGRSLHRRRPVASHPRLICVVDASIRWHDGAAQPPAERWRALFTGASCHRWRHEARARCNRLCRCFNRRRSARLVPAAGMAPPAAGLPSGAWASACRCTAPPCAAGGAVAAPRPTSAACSGAWAPACAVIGAVGTGAVGDAVAVGDAASAPASASVARSGAWAFVTPSASAPAAASSAPAGSRCGGTGAWTPACAPDRPPAAA